MLSGCRLHIVEKAGDTPPTTGHCYFCALRVIIDLDAARLSLLSLSSHFADVLRCGNAGAGAAWFRTDHRIGPSAAYKSASRTYLLPARGHSLRAAAGNPENSGERGASNRQMAARSCPAT